MTPARKNAKRSWERRDANKMTSRGDIEKKLEKEKAEAEAAAIVPVNLPWSWPFTIGRRGCRLQTESFKARLRAKVRLNSREQREALKSQASLHEALLTRDRGSWRTATR